MATMLVLFETGSADVSFDAVAIDELARLGVTHLKLVRDERTVGVVLEGWAFDPETSEAAALAVLAGQNGSARVLSPLGELALSTVQQKGILAR
jgi:hypothetical protein